MEAGINLLEGRIHERGRENQSVGKLGISRYANHLYPTSWYKRLNPDNGLKYARKPGILGRDKLKAEVQLSSVWDVPVDT